MRGGGCRKRVSTIIYGGGRSGSGAGGFGCSGGTCGDVGCAYHVLLVVIV